MSASPSTLASSSCAAVILAGGASRRFGSDKAWATWGERPVLEHLARSLAVACDPVLVVSRPGQDLPALPPSVVRLQDPAHLAGEGPLAGLLAALRWLDARGHARLFLTATDMPRVDFAVARALAGALAPRVAMATAQDAGGRAQPLCSAARVGPALRATEALLGAGERAISALPRALGAISVEVDVFSDARALQDFDTRDELDALLGG